MDKRYAAPRGRRRTSGPRPLLLLIGTALLLAAGCLSGIRWADARAFHQEPVWENRVSGTPAAGSEASQEAVPPAEEADTPWYLTLVNRWHPMAADGPAALQEVPGGQKVDERIYAPLMEMLEAAQAEGLGPVVVSGYRTWEKQQSLYDDKVRSYRREGFTREEAEELALQWVSAPGTSEHQLGLAVDINGDTYDIYLWLQEHSWSYGFIFRYPGDKTEQTGVAEEVWHYRYVGKEAAEEIHRQGLCLEEYLAAETP